jgi:hypothetical protein
MTADERDPLKRHFKSRWGGQFGTDDAARRAVRPASTDAPARDTGDQIEVNTREEPSLFGQEVGVLL